MGATQRTLAGRRSATRSRALFSTFIGVAILTNREAKSSRKAIFIQSADAGAGRTCPVGHKAASKPRAPRCQDVANGDTRHFLRLSPEVLLTLGRRRHLSSGQRDTGGRVRNLALSFSANSPRAAPVPRLIAVSRASGHVVSCARARARNFVASRTISIFSVSLWSVIVCVRIHAVIKNVTSLRHDTWRAGRTMDPSFDAAKITSILFCASRLCALRCRRRSGERSDAAAPRSRG